jgi:hypothetical protein
MSHRMVHLVGSIPFANASEVFERVAASLGGAVRSIPDGETGERLNWMGWLQPIFADHPQFESTGETFSPRAGGRETTTKFRLKPGVKPDQVRFDNLPFARIALESFEAFNRLCRRGIIGDGVRFQVALAGPISVLRRFVADEATQEALLPAYEDGLIRQVEEIAARVPHDRLAVQWDVASAVFERLERGEPNRFGASRNEMLASFVAHHVRLGMGVPKDVHLMYHLCYGDASHRHSIEPSSSGLLVGFANRLSADIGRTIELIHMPVPRDRVDEPYFEPLRDLRLRPETRLALGLVHYTDGVEGTRKRMAVAQKFVDDFAIATECGFGRRPPETVSRLLDIHAELARAPS